MGAVKTQGCVQSQMGMNRHKWAQGGPRARVGCFSIPTAFKCKKFE